MIAATDPQEFIPGGRQQALRHPGPSESVLNIQSTVSDDFLLRNFEKVSIVETKSSEWWTLRKTPNLFENNEEQKMQESKVENKKNYTVAEGNKLNVSDVSEESCSWKSAEGSVTNKNKRVSDINATKYLQNKRFSNESCHTSKSVSGTTVSYKNDYLKCKADLGYMEEELYVNGNVVIWSKGLAYNPEDDATRKTICSFSSVYPIKHALWCNFLCEKPMFESAALDVPTYDESTPDEISCICVIDSHNLKVFTTDNEDFITALPFQVSRVWSIKFGIMLERETCGDTSKCKALDDMSPTIFSLSHPLDEVSPLAIKRTAMHLIEDQAVQVVFTSESPSICMMYDSNTGQHSVYKIKKITGTERLEIINKSINPSHSIISNSSKLKSRLSLWDNIKSSLQMTAPSPLSSRATSLASMCSQMPSRSQSPMAAISRCQTPQMSPKVSNSLWLLRSTRLSCSLRNVESNTSISSVMTQYDTTEIQHSTIPELYLEHTWTDTVNPVQDVCANGPATKAFLSDDLTGQSYLCYLMPLRSQLSIVKVDLLNDGNLNFGILTSIGAKDAIAIPNLHMLAILEHNGNVVLYSGLTAVGKLHIGGVLAQHVPSPYIMRKNIKYFNSPFPRRSSLLPTCGPSVPDPRFDEHLLSPVLPALPSIRNPIVLQFSFQPECYSTIADSSKVHLCGLRDVIENRLTLHYSDGTYYRISLPLLGSSKLIESCLNALRQTLQRDASITLLTRWYATRNAPGSSDVTAEKEWEMFTNLVFELLGYDDERVSELPLDQPITPSSAAKRQRQSSFGTESDWNLLRKSDQHKTLFTNISNILSLHPESKPNKSYNKPSEIQINTSAVLFPNIRIIIYTLHILYEELKLNMLRKDELPLLAGFLSKIAFDLNLREYQLHYWKDFPDSCNVDCNIRKPIASINLKHVMAWPDDNDKPAGIFSFLYDLLNGADVQPFPYIRTINPRTRDVIQLWSTYIKSTENPDQEVVLDNFVRNIAPPGSKCDVSFAPKVETCDLMQPAAHRVVRLMTSMEITNRELESYPIGINLLLHDAIWQCRENPPSDWPTESYTLLHRPDLAAQAQIVEKKKEESAFMKYVNQSNVQEILPTVTQVETEQEDGMEDVDSALLKLRFPEDLRVSEARRLLQSSKPVPIVVVQRPDVSDHDFIEEQEKHLLAICTRTMALPLGRGMFTLRTASPVITEPLAIPPLCLTGKAPPRGSTIELSHIDTSPTMNLWPLFHNGVANGLRITPEAHNINSTWIIFNRPKGNSETEYAGFLMALGLNGHLKNLAVLNTFDYLVKFQEMISVGVLLGLSAAYRATSDISVTKMLSIHVEALLPPTSMELDIPQNVQVAGLMGIGLLYQGTAHRHMTEILLTEIGRPPGPEMENSVDRESYSLAAGLALGLVTLKQGGKPSGLSDLNVPDTLHYYMVGGNRRPLTGSQKDKYKVPSFQIREGSTVNLDVTAPGATLALGLTYLGSGNKAIADWMAPPDTQYLLDFVRPDFLMLRTLSRALIMWSDIQTSKDWVEKQVPDTIRPFCMVTPSLVLDIDYEAMNQAYCNIVAGACFALGLRYAGSANEEAFQTLLQFCHMFTSLTAKSIAELAGKPTIETCLNVVLLSASMVMAGTGNLDIMRIIRHLRRRVGVSTSAVVTYGSHLAIHMALGLLFLGGGRYTLSNTPGSVAALICALYPKFPTHSNDNRYHLQAFRHLYVLAVEPRLVIPKDIMMGRMCYANLKVIKLDGTSINMRGPGLIPDLSSLYKVCIDDERYWPVVFERGRNWEQLEKILSSFGCIEVKQRAGCLSYSEDKLGYRTELARTLTQSKIAPWAPPYKSIISFSSDCTIRNFCDHFLSEAKFLSKTDEAKLKQIIGRAAYDCVVKDKLNVLPMFVGLVKVMKDLNTSPKPLQLWQFKLVQTQILKRSFSTNLLSQEMILTLYQQIAAIFDTWECDICDALKSYIFGKTLNFNKHTISCLANFVVFYDVPYNCIISHGNDLETICDLMSKNVSTETIYKIMSLISNER